jgi:hypothetical protein
MVPEVLGDLLELLVLDDLEHQLAPRILQFLVVQIWLREQHLGLYSHQRCCH